MRDIIAKNKVTGKLIKLFNTNFLFIELLLKINIRPSCSLGMKRIGLFVMIYVLDLLLLVYPGLSF